MPHFWKTTGIVPGLWCTLKKPLRSTLVATVLFRTKALLSSRNQGSFVSGTMITARAQQAWMWVVRLLLVRFFYTLHRNLLHILSPSCFAVCGHHLSSSIATVFSLLPNASNDLCHLNLLPALPPLACLVPPYKVHILPLYVFYSLLLCHKGKSMRLLLPALDY